MQSLLERRKVGWMLPTRIKVLVAVAWGEEVVERYFLCTGFGRDADESSRRVDFLNL
jgi:hypothetical protein